MAGNDKFDILHQHNQRMKTQIRILLSIFMKNNPTLSHFPAFLLICYKFNR